MPSNGKKKSVTKNTGKVSSVNKSRERNESSQATKQVAYIVIFALALFLLAIVLIPGQNFWNDLHNVLFGLLGVCTYFLPIAIGLIAVFGALDKLTGNVKSKIWESFVLVVLIDTAIDIFASDQTLAFAEHIKQSWALGSQLKSGGFFGALLGHPLVHLIADKTGAAIIVFLLIFVILLVMTGTTLINFFKTLSKPVKHIERAAADNYAERRARREEEELEEDEGQERFERKRDRKEKKIPLPPRMDEEKNSVDISLTDDEEREKAELSSRQKKDKLIDLYNGNTPEPEETSATDDTVPPPTDNDAPPAPMVDEVIKKDVDFEAPDDTDDGEDTDVKDDIDLLEEGKTEDAVPAKPAYIYPPMTLLAPVKPEDNRAINNELETVGNNLVKVLQSFGVETEIINISRGPAVTRYELKPSAGVKISKITGLADDIALNLASSGVRIEAPIPNKAAVGIEVPNKMTNIVGVREVIDSTAFTQAKSKLTVALGKDIAGAVTVTDITKMPHGLIAGATGSGKSVCINSIIVSILYKATPDEVKLLLIDPKVVELGVYNGIPHLLIPVVTDPRKAAGALGWAVQEMERRYKAFAENDVRNLDGYNALAENREDLEKMPQIVIIIDELADLMMTAPGDVEDAICRIAQKARAAGMHLIVATQRPSVDVVTGLIKANIPTRIAFAVSSQIDSRTILDVGGAEKLMGRGDMLFYPVGATKPQRIQGCFVSDTEVENVVNFIKKAQKATYSDEIAEEIERIAAQEKNKKNSKGEQIENGEDADPMLNEAIEVVVEVGQASTSLLQRRLKLGYSRAARIIDQMEARGVVDGYQGAKPRNVLITKEQFYEMKMRESEEK